MTIYAVMKTGGKEYRVAQGDVLRVEKLAAAPGATVEICEISSIETAHGVTVGSPTVAGARVIADIIEEGHGEKILIFKKKRRDHYQMMTGDLQSYSTLRIREIVVAESVYAAASPRLEVAAPPPPPPPRISKPEHKVAEPQATKAPQPLMPSAPASRASIGLVPSMAADTDAPVFPEVANEEAVRPVHAVEPPPLAASSTGIPPTRFAPPLRVVTGAPVPAVPAVAERGARKRSHRITALVAGLRVMAAGLVVLGSREPQAPGQAAVEVATVAPPPQAAQPSVPPPAAKAPPRKELAVRKTAAASAPSAPVQPPE